MGSTSFGGGWLVEVALTAGYDVIGISRSSECDAIFQPYKDNSRKEKFTYHQLDINIDTDKIISLLATTRPSFIVDFAGQGMVAPSWQWPEQWYKTNVASKAKLINGIKEHDYCQRYVRVSTPEVYGSNSEMVDEDAQYNPTTPYSISHVAIDMHLMAYHRQFNFPVILTRFANFYGSTQQLFRIVPRAFISAMEQRTLPLHGGGHSIRSFIHGMDVATGLLLALEQGEIGRTYHFSNDEFITIRDLVIKIAAITSVDFDKFIKITEDRPGKDAAYLMQSQRARTELGWNPRFDLRAGLQETHQWLVENANAIRTLNLEYEHRE